ncbi:hypothetical protein EDD18DRAFT_1378287 [Armillaria luteobubalina]|uniref:DUF6535 domain-containing protein n=1 Tax=Armillaria luteobubalina TaxID=153913 RepID=A0AA39Q8E9_9AGAR|nr:hypothetical protein EDD18DRAFT_1378287 [Armillaria luteobubalina]
MDAHLMKGLGNDPLDYDQDSDGDSNSSVSDTSGGEAHSKAPSPHISQYYSGSKSMVSVQSDSDGDSSASDTSKGEAHSRTPPSSQGYDPKVKKLTSHSQHRRCKTRRRIMGMERAEYINKENYPFDYEKKFPEDKHGEELGPAARVWRTCIEESATSDGEMVEGWRDGLDVLLVFAGLFLAVVTTFVTQTSQSLQVNYSQVTTLLLIKLINVQCLTSNRSFINDVLGPSTTRSKQV